MLRRSAEEHAEHVRRLEAGEWPYPPGDEPPPPFRPRRLQRYGELFRQKAERLIETGSVTIETNGTPINCRLILFDDDSAVFEHEYRSPWGGGSGMSHYEPGAATVEEIAHRLEFACLNARFRPIAGQEI